MSDIKKSGLVQYILIDLRSGLWFVPALMIFGAVGLAIGLVELDPYIDGELRQRWPRLFDINAEGARSMLSAIAGAIATVAGVAFSITIVALVLASTQYTSRVLRNFTRDRANQLVLGILIGVFIYCLLVLRSIGGENGNFVPALAVHAALVLAFVASALFIFFIHHISTSIQASDMAEGIAKETVDAIDLVFPAQDEDTGNRLVEYEIPEDTRWQPVPATSRGYIQSVDLQALFEFAKSHGTMVRMDSGIGDFAAQDRPLVSLSLPESPDREMVKKLNKIYAIDTYRTIEQDPAFGIRQLVDMSLKALSPGINDTTTATTCIEHLSVLLARCARRGAARPFWVDGGTLRLIVHQPNFPGLLSLAFSQILENAEKNTEIILCMLGAIEHIAGHARHREKIAALDTQVNTIEEVVGRHARLTSADERLAAALAQVRAAFRRQEFACRL